MSLSIQWMWRWESSCLIYCFHGLSWSQSQTIDEFMYRQTYHFLQLAFKVEYFLYFDEYDLPCPALWRQTVKGGSVELYSFGPAWTRLSLMSDVCTVQTCPSSTDWRSRVVVCRYSMLVSPHTLLRTLILCSEYEETYSVKYIVHDHHHHHHHQWSVWVDSECESEMLKPCLTVAGCVQWWLVECDSSYHCL